MPRACHSSLFVLWGEGGGTGLQWRLPLLHGGWLQVSALLAHGSCSKRDGLFVGARARARARYFVVSTRARVQGSYCPGGGPIYACASGSTTTSTGATSSAACVRASLPPGSYAERCVPFRLPFEGSCRLILSAVEQLLRLRYLWPILRLRVLQRLRISRANLGGVRPIYVAMHGRRA